MAKGYIIKNKKSEYFFTNQSHFEKLGYNTKIYKDYQSAYKDLERAVNCQVWDLVEVMYGKDRWDLDYPEIDTGILDNIREHVDLAIKGLYMAEGNI